MLCVLLLASILRPLPSQEMAFCGPSPVISLQGTRKSMRHVDERLAEAMHTTAKDAPPAKGVPGPTEWGRAYAPSRARENLLSPGFERYKHVLTIRGSRSVYVVRVCCKPHFAVPGAIRRRAGLLWNHHARGGGKVSSHGTPYSVRGRGTTPGPGRTQLMMS